MLLSGICGDYARQLESNVLFNSSISHPMYVVFQHTTDLSNGSALSLMLTFLHS